MAHYTGEGMNAFIEKVNGGYLVTVNHKFPDASRTVYPNMLSALHAMVHHFDPKLQFELKEISAVSISADMSQCAAQSLGDMLNAQGYNTKGL